MRLLFFVSLALFSTVLGIDFITPVPVSGKNDYSNVPTYPTESTFVIQWTPGPAGNRTSLTLFQMNGTEYLFPFEYLTQNAPSDTTSFSWTVATTKNLTISNTFSLAIYLEGVTRTTTQSSYFNITERNVAKPDTTSSTSLTTSTVVSTITSSSTLAPPISIPSSATSATTSVVPTPDDRGLSTGAKAGIGIGAIAVLVLGIITGWFVFGRRKKQEALAPTYSASELPIVLEQEKWQERRYQQDTQSTMELETMKVTPSFPTYELPAVYRN